MTRSTVHQIERARAATLRLRAGHSIQDVVFETGYYDQAHLTRSLKHFVGLTPALIAHGDQQLSFLYNTDPT
jgi:AraC-like DNA-binding protein